nr:site-specific integrase [Streptomyces gossypiisoli]
MKGRATSTRREYVQIFKGFHRFLQARKAADIEAAFGVRLVCPVDEFNASRHVGDDSPALTPPPTPDRMAEFFHFLKQRIATARKYGPAARDYAMFRTLYHAGLRSEEASLLDKPDVHFSRGPFGKLHVRFGKGAHTSGPRPRWVPMLDGLDLVLRWFLEDVRPKFPDSPVLFADESGSSLHRGTIRNRLRYLSSKGARPQTGSARMSCGGPARPTTTNAASTWWRSSKCSGTGRSARPCVMSGPPRRSSRTPISGPSPALWPS